MALEKLWDSPEPSPMQMRDKWLNGNNQYNLPDPNNPGKRLVLTRASTFAGAIDDNYLLHNWELRKTAQGVAMDDGIAATVAATDPGDRETLQGLVYDAMVRAGSKTRAQIGTAVHTFTEQQDRGQEVTAPAKYMPEVDAYRAMLAELGVEILPDLIERIVVNLTTKIAGRFDRIVRLTKDLDVTLPDGRVFHLKAGQFVMLDLKTGDELKFGWLKFMVGQHVYCTAEAMFDEETETYGPMPPLNQDVALILHLPIRSDKTKPAEAHLFGVDLSLAAEMADACQTVRTLRGRAKLPAPIRTVMVETFPKPADNQYPWSAPEPVQQEWLDEAAQAESVQSGPAFSTPALDHPALGQPDVSSPAVSGIPLEQGACRSSYPDNEHVCAITDPKHVTHKDRDFRWPVADLPDGTACPECSRTAKKGKITHERKCVENTRSKEATPRGTGQSALVQATAAEPVQTVLDQPGVQAAYEQHVAARQDEITGGQPTQRLQYGANPHHPNGVWGLWLPEFPHPAEGVNEHSTVCRHCGLGYGATELHRVAVIVRPPGTPGPIPLYTVPGTNGGPQTPQPLPAPQLTAQLQTVSADQLSWEERIGNAQSKPDMSDIYFAASAAGQWTTELERLGMKRLADLGLA